MELSLKKISLTKLTRIGIAALTAIMLAACGGGGGSAGTTIGTGTGTGNSTGNGTIQIVLVDASGTAKNTVTNGNPLLAKATVTDDLGVPLQNKIVTFSVSTSIVTISPADGTALTDINGVAQVNIQSAGLGGAGEVTASVTVGATPVTAKAAFSVGAAPTATPAAINFVSAVPADKSIVIKGSGGNGRTEVALLTFSVVDSSNNGVANKTVNFSTQSTEAVTLISSSGITDQNGQVTVALTSGEKPTTVSVIATVVAQPGPPAVTISAISDTVTVTTGQPTQAGFSISREKSSVEGWDIDNVKNKITVLLVDAFGGAVADGTQIVFTTDSGGIVGSGGAKCLTGPPSNAGECSVDWRSQNPRNNNGLVTVTATATNGSANLAVTTQFFSSGKFAVVTLLSAPLNFTASCTPQTIQIKVADVNGNPMADLTTLTAVNATNASVIITPDKVSPVGAGGTIHNLTVTPSGCDLAGTKFVSGFFDVNVTTPLGNQTTTRIQLGTFKTL